MDKACVTFDVGHIQTYTKSYLLADMYTEGYIHKMHMFPTCFSLTSSGSSINF